MAKKPDEEWIVSSRAKVAELFSVSVQAIGNWAHAGMPGEHGRYDLKEIVKWKLDQTKPKPAKQDGEKSDHLEKQREYKAEMLRLELEEQKKQLVRLPKVSEFLNRFANRLQEYGETLQRTGRDDEFHLLQDLLGELEQDVERELNGHN